MSGSALKRPRVRRSVKRFADLLDTAAKRLLLSVSLSFSLASASRFERFCRRVAQLVERCLDTAEVWGSSPHAPTIFMCGSLNPSQPGEQGNVVANSEKSYQPQRRPEGVDCAMSRKRSS